MEQSEARAAMDELALQQLQMYPHLSSIMGQVQVHHVSSFCVQRVNKSDNVRPSLGLLCGCCFFFIQDWYLSVSCHIMICQIFGVYIF